MKTATLKELKIELQEKSPIEMMELCLRLSKFKKENKELLTYLLFEAQDEEHYISEVKNFILLQFEAITPKNIYYTKKSVRKILREIKKYIRYSQKKETEIELLLFFCTQLKAVRPSVLKNTTLRNLYERQLQLITKKITTLHEDLQYDYLQEMEILQQ